MNVMHRATHLHDESGRARFNKSLWFIVIAVSLLLMVGIDGASIFFTRIQLEQQAIDAGSEAANSPGSDAFTAAESQMTDPDAKVLKDDFSVDKKTGAVTLTVQKQAGTLFVQHIGPIEHWATVTVTKTIGPNTA